MWLWDKGLAIRTDKALINQHVGYIPAMIAGLPLTFAYQTSHSRGRTTLVLAAEDFFIGPVAGLRAVGANLAVNCIHNRIFADQAWDHAGPAAMRIDITSILEGDRFVAVRFG